MFELSADLGPLALQNKRLRVWREAKIQQGIYVASSLIPKQLELERFAEDGLTVVDTEEEGAVGGDYYDLRCRALRRAKRDRLNLEQKLVAEWRACSEAEGQFLIVDGTLMNMRDERNVDRCVGVSKSFGSRYFDVPTHNRIINMNEAERSWTFRFHSPDDALDDQRLGVRERVSWYLRLRRQPNSDPEYGLVRVEISKRYADGAAEFAERFSRSLMSERLPTSYPAPRWDKHLFPIRECENYLSSIIPSIATIQASMGG